MRKEVRLSTKIYLIDLVRISRNIIRMKYLIEIVIIKHTIIQYLDLISINQHYLIKIHSKNKMKQLLYKMNQL